MPLAFDDFVSNILDPEGEAPHALPLETFLNFPINAELHTLIKSKFSMEKDSQLLLSIQTCALLVFAPLLPLWNSEKPLISFLQLLDISQPAATILHDETLFYLFTGENPLFTINEILNITNSASKALKNDAIRTMLTQKPPLLNPQQILEISPQAQRNLANPVIRQCAIQPEPLFSLQDILTERYPLEALTIKEIYNLFLEKKFTLQDLCQITDAALLALKDDEIRPYLLQDPELDLVKDIFRISLNAYRGLGNEKIFALTQKPYINYSFKELLSISDLGLVALKTPLFRALIEGAEPKIAPHYLLNITFFAFQLLENNETRGFFLGENPYFTQEELFNKMNTVARDALFNEDIRELLTENPPKITPERILELETDSLAAILESLPKVKSGEISLIKEDTEVKKTRTQFQFPTFVAPKPQENKEEVTHGLEYK